ncbi:MAG: sporulation protein, partial [Clostridia bacterium]|nr:sporulation protein [Clostridia bacterium]
RIGRLLDRPMAILFGVPGVCATAFVLGLIGGYPVGAYNAVTLYRSGACTRTQAERLLAFCNNCGPAFILGVVGASVFGCTAAGVLLYSTHILSSVLIGIGFGFYRRGERDTLPPAPKTSAPREQNLATLLTGSVKTSAQSIINVCAYVVFFSVAVRLLHLTGIIPALARVLAAFLRPFDLPASFSERLIGGIFEMTGGVSGIAEGGKLVPSLTGAAFMLGWAGLSVHFQVLDFMSDSGLSPRPYITGKLLHGGLSAVLAYIGAQLIPFDVQTSGMLEGQISAIYSCPWVYLALAAAVCSVCVWGILWLVSRIFARK